MDVNTAWAAFKATLPKASQENIDLAENNGSISYTHEAFNAGYRARAIPAWVSLKDDSPEPDSIVLMWDKRGFDNCVTWGYSVEDFDHDSDANYWLEHGFTHWAPLKEPQ